MKSAIPGGVAMLVASALAGLLWDKIGASVTFYAGAGFVVIASILLNVPFHRRTI